MKIAVIGAGAMGSLYGSRLSRGNQVIMIDSSDRVVQRIQELGITVRENDGQEKTYKENITAFRSEEYSDKPDLVIMFVKSTYLSDAAKWRGK